MFVELNNTENRRVLKLTPAKTIGIVIRIVLLSGSARPDSSNNSQLDIYVPLVMKSVWSIARH